MVNVALALTIVKSHLIRSTCGEIRQTRHPGALHKMYLICTKRLLQRLRCNQWDGWVNTLALTTCGDTHITAYLYSVESIRYRL